MTSQPAVVTSDPPHLFRHAYSAQRLPFSLHVAWLRFRPITPKGRALFAALATRVGYAPDMKINPRSVKTNSGIRAPKPNALVMAITHRR